MGSNFKSILERLQFGLQSQERESRLLRDQLQAANERASRANEVARDEFRHMLAQERKTAETERRVLLSNVKDLIDQMAERQTTRVETGFGKTLNEIDGANDSLQESHRHYNEQMDICDTKKDSVLRSISVSKERIEKEVDEVSRVCWTDSKPRYVKVTCVANILRQSHSINTMKTWKGRRGPPRMMRSILFKIRCRIFRHRWKL